MPGLFDDILQGGEEPAEKEQQLDPFDPEGVGYDMATARQRGITADDTGHYPSLAPLSPEEATELGLPPESGLVLKGRSHPTFDKTLEAERALGRQIIEHNGRLYSVPAAPEPELQSPDDMMTMGGSSPPAPEPKGLFDDIVPPGEEIGRLQTAAGQFVTHLGQMAGAAPKSIAIAADARLPARRILELMDRIDSGQATRDEIMQIQAVAPGYHRLPPEEKERVRANFSAIANRTDDPRDNPLYQAGQAIDEFMSNLIATNPRYKEEFWAGKVSGALGSMTGFVLATLATGPAGAAGLGAAAGSVQGFEDALQSGASIEDALRSSGLNAVVGTSEAIPIARILDRIDKGTGGVIRRALVNAIKGGTEEAIQESFQQILGNLIASDIVEYDPERGLFIGADEGGAVGFTSGAIVALLGTLIGGRRSIDVDEREPVAAEDVIGREEPEPEPAPQPAQAGGLFDDIMAADAADAGVSVPATPRETPAPTAPDEPVTVGESLFSDIVPDLGTTVPETGTLDERAHEAATSPENELPEPTDAQKEAGNYRKGHARLHGLDISIENPAGSKRRPEWPALAHHYGYIRGTKGKDKDHIDVFLGPRAEDPRAPVFVVDQINPKTGKFDEHKVMLGFTSEESAREGYQANYSPGWQGLGAIKRLTLPEFKLWLKYGNTKKPLALKGDLKPTLEQTDAARIREDARQVPPGGPVGEGRQAEGRTDLQRAAQARPAARGARQVEYVDPRLKREAFRDMVLRTVERDMVEGGGVAVVPDHTFKPGEALPESARPMVRTPSVHAPWIQTMLEETGLSVKQVRKAAEKAVRGEPLGIRQATAVQFILNHITDERTDPRNIEYVREQLREAREIRRQIRAPLASMEEVDRLAEGAPEPEIEQAGELFEEAEYAPEMEAIQRVILEAAEAARERGGDPDRIEEIMSQRRPDAEVLRDLILYGEELRHGEQPERGEAGRDTGVPGERAQGPQAQEAREDEGEFLRPSPGAPQRRERRAPAQQDLIGGRSETQQAVHERRLERERRIAEAPPVESQEGDLFSGRARQRDIEDVTGRPVAAPATDEAAKATADAAKQLAEAAKALQEAAQEIRGARAEPEPRREPPKAQEGVAEYNTGEDEGTPYQADLFGDPLPQRGGRRRPSPARRDVHSAVAVRLATQSDAPGVFGVETALVSERSRSIPSGNITTPRKAAEVTAHLARYADEHFDAIVTDDAGKPLAVIGAFKGTLDGTAVYPRTLMYEAIRVKGARRIWMSHNHPSGVSRLSGADRVLLDRLAEHFDGSGIKIEGILAIGARKNGRYSYSFSRPGGVGEEEGEVTPAKGELSIPIVERVFVKDEGLGDKAIESPQDAKLAVSGIASDQPGIVILNTRHHPIAFVPVAPSEAGRLKNTPALRRIYRAFSRANASAAIIANPNNAYTDSQQTNLANMLAAQEIRPLDVISYEWTPGGPVNFDSKSDRGRDISTGRVFFSRDRRRARSEYTPPEGVEIVTTHKRAAELQRQYDPTKATDTPTGSARALDVTETPEFRRWFGDSKVVDEQGRPKVVYRGIAGETETAGSYYTDSARDASAYAELAALRKAVEENEELGNIVSEILSEEGGDDITDLGPDRVREIAEANGVKIESEAANVLPVYLRIENPLDLTAYGSDIGDVAELWDALHADGLLSEAWAEIDEDAQIEVEEQYRDQALYRFLEGEGIVAKAFELGHDGVVFVDMAPDGGSTHQTYVVKDDTQVKSAIGNRGTFDPKSPNILFSRTGRREPERDLIIQHNLSAENLLHAARMGGIPVPSLAVTRVGSPLSGFGEITLLGPAEMADPRGYARTQVFGADIYSPRYPTIHYKVPGPALKRLNEKLAPYRQEGDREIFGAEITKAEDLTHNAAFKRYAREKLGEDVNRWHRLKALAEETLREVGAEEKLFRGFTYAGNRRYQPHNLENVVKILKKELRGGEGFNYGLGSVRARFTPRFRSLQQIRREKGRLMSKEDFAKVKEEVDAEFRGLWDKLAPYHKHRSSFSASASMGDILTDTLGRAAQVGIPRALKENQFEDVPFEVMREMGEFMAKLRTLPTEYFEAKILRSVDLGEFRAAVVPNDVPERVVEILRNRGVKVARYKPNDEADRRRVIEKTAREMGEEVLFSRGLTGQDTVLTAAFKLLAQDDAAFQLPRTRQLDMFRIVRDMDPTIRVEDETWLNRNKSIRQQWRFTMPNGRKATAYETVNGRIVLNASGLTTGSGGSRLYQILGTYAHNNGKRFIGDPEGVSEDAIHRRLENLISSALRFGTTAHIELHPDQLRRFKIDWKPGQDEHNLDQMLRASYNYVVQAVPEIRNVTYDFQTGQFKRDGRPLSDDDFARLAESAWAHRRGGVSGRAGRAGVPPGGVSVGRTGPGALRGGQADRSGEATPPIGSTTLKRAALANTVVRTAGRDQRRSLLGEIVRKLREGVARTPLERTLYRLDAEARPQAGLSASSVREILKKPLKRLEGTIPVEIVDRVEQLPFEAPSDVRGAYYQGQVWLVAENLTEQEALRTLTHEVVGHLGLETLLGPKEFKALLNEVNLMKRAGNKAIQQAAQHVFETHGKLDPDTEAREILAYLAESGIQNSLIRRIVAAIRRFLARMGLADLGTAEIESLIARAARFVEGAGTDTVGEAVPAFQRAQPGTSAFRRWFGDSKVVDEEGDPLVVYHGTNDVIERFEFDHPHRKDDGWLGRGFYFTNKADIANAYTTLKPGASANVMPVYLRIENPYMATLRDKERLMLAVRRGDRDAPRRWTEELREQGHDGVILDYGMTDGAREYVVFSPEQIKSAIGNRGTFDPADPDIAHARREPMFYSAMQRVLTERLPAAGPAEKLREQIQNMVNSGLFKREEWEWSGVDEWLAEQKGKVTKDDVLEFLRDNEIRVEEKLRGPRASRDRADFDTALAERHRLQAANGDIWERNPGATEPEHLSPEDREELERNIAAMDELDRVWFKEPEPTKYESYVLPGGEDYRELVLTLPLPPRYQTRKAIFERYEPRIQALHERITNPNLSQAERDAALAERERLEEQRDREAAAAAGEAGHDIFRSSHFGEPNIIAHVRFNERTDTDGKRVLFIEEIQSDWAQQGKRSGFREPGQQSAVEEAQANLRTAARRLQETGLTWEGDTTAWRSYNERGQHAVPVAPVQLGNGRWTLGYPDGRVRDGYETLPTFETAEQAWDHGYRGRNDVVPMTAEQYEAWNNLRAAFDALNRAQVDEHNQGRLPPRAPFVTKTDSWVSLAVKRMIRWAAENGFERIAWTTGEQQAERYDLSKQIDAIDYSKLMGGGYRIVAIKDGENFISKNVTEQELPDVVGKDVAEKIIRGEGEASPRGAARSKVKRLSGIDLKVGGEGMKAFYDKMLPAIVNKYVKKWGAKVGLATLDVPARADALPAGVRIRHGGREGWGIWDENDEDWVDVGFATKEEAVQAARSVWPAARAGEAASVHAFDVTPEMRDAAMRGQPLFARAAPGRTMAPPDSVVQVLREGRPVEFIFRGLFELAQIPRATKWFVARIEHGLTQAKFKNVAEDGFLGRINQMLETARAGLLDRYGLTEEYIRLDRKREANLRRVALKGVEIVENMKKSGINAQEAEVLQAVLTGEQIPDEKWSRLAEPIRKAIDELGAEAVELGLLDPETYERNRATYLHRVYKRHEAEQQVGIPGFVARIMSSRRKKIIGNALKHRGMKLEIALERLPEVEIGSKVHVYDRMGANGKVARRAFTAGPSEQHKDWVDRGEWKVIAVRGEKAVLWRDFTKEERMKMGEILDSRYTIAKTFQVMAHDLATGRFLKEIADNPDWTWHEEGEPPNSGIPGRRLATYTQYEWIRVPDTPIPGTSGKKRWGALAGKYVRAEIWRDLNELDQMQRVGLWSALMTQWKLNKTARNPVVHMNNVMSNVVLMDMADVRMRDVYRAIHAMRHQTEDYKEAQINGAFGGTFIMQEIRRNLLNPLLDEIMQQSREDQGTFESKIGLVGKMLDVLWKNAKKFDRGMIELYQLEDEIFRMATYMRRRSLGDTPEVAANVARDQFLNYDIRAPWVNVARQTLLPFIAYTYRAVPIIAKTVAERPWKLAKYATIGYLANAMGYALAPGDEEEERRSMREEVTGYTWIGSPRLIRMPYYDDYGNPVFLDVRRWIPAGDIFDTNQGQLPIPAPFQFSGPLMIATELALNRSAFTGQDIYNERTATGTDIARDVGAHLYRAWMPSAPWIYESWYWEKIERAAKGGRDPLGRPYSVGQAVASSVGLKLQPHDVKYGFAIHGREIEATRRELEQELRFLELDRERRLISEEAYAREKERLRAKFRNLEDEARRIFRGE
jgi:hypothetical protein